MKRKMIQTIFAISIAIFVLTGCSSMRMTTTLKTDPEMKKQQVADGVKFYVGAYSTKLKGKALTIGHPMWVNSKQITFVNHKSLKNHALKVYPGLFGNHLSDLHVSVHVDFEYSRYELGRWVQGLTLWTIPFPSWFNVDCTVHIKIWNGSMGEWLKETESFTQKSCWWGDTWNPLALLPVPGFSDFRSSTNLMGSVSGITNEINKSMANFKKSTSDSLTEAVARSIRRIDPNKLKAAQKSRKARFRKFDINGRTFWSFLTYPYTKSKGQLLQNDLVLFNEYPTLESKPFETVTLARMKDGAWQPVTVYLRRLKGATTVTVLLVDGKPLKVVIKKVDKPPLEDFIELPTGSSCGDIRRNNDILIEIKNSTLPQLIREKKSEYMIKLVTRIEKAGLRLNSHAQKLDNKVQKEMVAGGKVDTTQLSEMSALCRQRITIFKPILSVLKRAIHLKRTIEKKKK